MRPIYLLFVLPIFFFTCTTKDGNILSFQSGTGSLEVTSTVPGARVFVDYRDSGKRTPAVIENLPEGEHVVHLFLSKHEASPESLIVNIRQNELSAIDFELTKSPTVGNMIVTSHPDSALVYVNRLPLGRTPLTIEGLAVGIHHLRVIKGNYATVEQMVQVTSDQVTEVELNLQLYRQVLVEHFSNTDCTPCPAADAAIEEVLRAFGADSVAGISYHPNFPGSEDPMFLAAEQDNLARMNYYRLLAIPTVIVDGVITILSPNNLATLLTNAIETRIPEPPIATLDLRGFREVLHPPGDLRGTVVVEALESFPEDVVLRIALIEKEIEFEVAPGINGQKRFTDVMRDFYPDAGGTPVQLATGESARFDFAFDPQPEWSGELVVVAFLQVNSTKEILNCIWSVLPE